MKLQTAKFTFTLLTPAFVGTALGRYSDRAEMRVPPIRGMVRFWHRALYGVPDANNVWGATAGEEGRGSRVSLHLKSESLIGKDKERLLPHCNPNSQDKLEKRKAQSKSYAISDGKSFTIELQRLVGCSSDDWQHAQNALKLWLLVGCIGLRANRAAGSVWPQDNFVPRTPEDFRRLLRDDLGFTWSLKVGRGDNLNASALRETASDTRGGNPIFFGGCNPRVPSPVKFKVVQFSDGPALLAMAQDQNTLDGALNCLLRKGRWQRLSWEVL